MEFKPYKVDGFLTDWFKISEYPLSGTIHTIYNHKNGNRPHILYNKFYEYMKPFNYDEWLSFLLKLGKSYTMGITSPNTKRPPLPNS